MPNEPYLGYYPEAELIFAIVCPFGADHGPVIDTLNDYLTQFGYDSHRLRLSELFPGLLVKLEQSWKPPANSSEMARYKIEIGNRNQRPKRGDQNSCGSRPREPSDWAVIGVLSTPNRKPPLSVGYRHRACSPDITQPVSELGVRLFTTHFASFLRDAFPHEACAGAGKLRSNPILRSSDLSVTVRGKSLERAVQNPLKLISRSGYLGL
jgi:hypothetical protein